MIIIINGCPSAGKTSIVKEIQKRYSKPLLNLGIDRFWAMIPDQYKEYGSKAAEGYSFTKTTDSHGHPIITVHRGSFAQHLDKTMPHAINTFAQYGHDLIVDEIFDDQTIRNYAQALQKQTVYLIGITCSIEELERREKARANRELGLARGHVDFVHAHQNYYDLIIDNTNLDPATCAEKIIDFIARNIDVTRSCLI